MQKLEKEPNSIKISSPQQQQQVLVGRNELFTLNREDLPTVQDSDERQRYLELVAQLEADGVTIEDLDVDMLSDGIHTAASNNDDGDDNNNDRSLEANVVQDKWRTMDKLLTEITLGPQLEQSGGKASAAVPLKVPADHKGSSTDANINTNSDNIDTADAATHPQVASNAIHTTAATQQDFASTVVHLTSAQKEQHVYGWRYPLLFDLMQLHNSNEMNNNSTKLQRKLNGEGLLDMLMTARVVIDEWNLIPDSGSCDGATNSHNMYIESIMNEAKCFIQNEGLITL